MIILVRKDGFKPCGKTLNGEFILDCILIQKWKFAKKYAYRFEIYDGPHVLVLFLILAKICCFFLMHFAKIVVKIDYSNSLICER